MRKSFGVEKSASMITVMSVSPPGDLCSYEGAQCPPLFGSERLPRGARWWLGLGCSLRLFSGGGLHLWGHQEPGCVPPGSDGGVWGEQQPCVVGYFHLCLHFFLFGSVMLIFPTTHVFRDFVLAEKM